MNQATRRALEAMRRCDQIEEEFNELLKRQEERER